MSQQFLNSANEGKNAWWRYLLGVLLLILFSLGGAVAIEFLLAAVALSSDSSDSATRSPEVAYVTSHIAYLCLYIGLLTAVKVLHERKFLSLISADATFRVGRFCAGFGVWFVLAGVQTLIEYWLTPQGFEWNWQPDRWLAFLPLALLLTPIQTSTEELLFRGYLLQGLGLLVRQPVILLLAAGLPFAIVHFGNPEMARGAIWIGLAYFVLAVFLTAITLKDDRLELAMGVHAANNLFIVLFVNTQDSVLQTPSLLIQTAPTDARITVVTLLLACGVFYWLFFSRNRERAKEK